LAAGAASPTLGSRLEASLQPIRILIAELPPMLRDIVLDTIAEQPDLEVVGVVEDGFDIAGEVHRTGATVVIVGSEEQRGAAGHSSLLQRAAAPPGVVVLTRDGREAFLEVALGELSPQRLVDTVRQVPTISSD
jgi:AmiR/NasT family two-component response regulator